MSRRGITWSLCATLAVLVAAVAWHLAVDRGQTSTAARARAARARERREQLREESGHLMPDPIRGIALGMRIGDVRRARPHMSTSGRNGSTVEEPNLVLYEENLENGARVVYGFDDARLDRVQVLSLLPNTSAIAPHLRAMNDRYGRPTGMWDCPNTGSVPTRRFTWRHGPTTVSDIFLIYGGRVSVTFYIAPTEVMSRSLTRSSCVPLTDIERFPVASPEEVTGAGAH
jgi:hypothetical protein